MSGALNVNPHRDMNSLNSKIRFVSPLTASFARKSFGIQHSYGSDQLICLSDVLSHRLVFRFLKWSLKPEKISRWPDCSHLCNAIHPNRLLIVWLLQHSQLEPGIIESENYDARLIQMVFDWCPTFSKYFSRSIQFALWPRFVASRRASFETWGEKN